MQKTVEMLRQQPNSLLDKISDTDAIYHKVWSVPAPLPSAISTTAGTSRETLLQKVELGESQGEATCRF